MDCIFSNKSLRLRVVGLSAVTRDALPLAVLAVVLHQVLSCLLRCVYSSSTQ
jgi:hypothetical protein